MAATISMGAGVAMTSGAEKNWAEATISVVAITAGTTTSS